MGKTSRTKGRAGQTQARQLLDSRDSRKARPRWGMYDRRAAKAIIEAGARFDAMCEVVQ